MDFTGFPATVFENYREPKSRSNVYSRQRLEVKERLLEIAAPSLENLRAGGRALEILASDHHPSVWNRKVVDRQWIFLSRDREARAALERLVDRDRNLASTLMDPTPFFKHAFLCLVMDGEGFEAAVKLHWRAWVDRDNALARLSDDADREAFLDLVTALPDEYAIGVEGGKSLAVGDLGADGLGRIVEEFRTEEGLFGVGIRVKPEQVEALGPDLAGVASAALSLLDPVHEHLSWSEDNDLVSLSERAEEIDEEMRQVAEEHRLEREAFESQKRERKEQQARRFEEERESKMEQQAFRERLRRLQRAAAVRAAEEEAAARVRAAEEAAAARVRAAEAGSAETEPEAAGETSSATAPPAEEKRPSAAVRPATPRPGARRPGAAPRPGRKATAPASGDVVPGVRVEITQGVLAGKWGILQEIDKHGQSKVVLGSMVARVPAADLRRVVPRPRPRRPKR